MQLKKSTAPSRFKISAICLTSANRNPPGPSSSALVLRDLVAFEHQVRILHGGMAAWLDAGHPVESGIGSLLSRPTDTYFESDHYDDFQVHLREHHAYLNWEIALIDHIVGDPAVRYKVR